MERKKIIFIVSLPRSGSTYFGQKLSSDSSLNYIGENTVFWETLYFYYQRGQLTRKHINVILSIFESFEKQYIIDKTPSNCLHCDMLRFIFPNCKIIFLHREFEDIFNSTFREWKSVRNQALDSIELRKRNFILRSYFSLKKNLRLINIHFVYKFPFVIYLIGLKSFYSILLRSTKSKFGYWGPYFIPYKSHLFSSTQRRVYIQVIFLFNKFNFFSKSILHNTFNISFNDVVSHNKVYNKCIDFIKFD